MHTMFYLVRFIFFLVGIRHNEIFKRMRATLYIYINRRGGCIILALRDIFLRHEHYRGGGIIAFG